MTIKKLRELYEARAEVERLKARCAKLEGLLQEVADSCQKWGLWGMPGVIKEKIAALAERKAGEGK